MNSLQFAFTLIKRFKFESIMIAVSLFFLSATTTQITRHLKSTYEYRQKLLNFKTDIIASKGNSLDHLNSLLKLDTSLNDQFENYIPYNLYNTLSSDPKIQFEDGQQFNNTHVVKLTPLLIWGSFKSQPIIGTNENILNYLNQSQIQMVESNEVLISRKTADKYNLSVGQEIDIPIKIGHYLNDEKIVKIKIASLFTSPDTQWDNALFTNINFVHDQLASLNFDPALIWKSSILNYILVDGIAQNKEKLQQLVDKRTVATYIQTEKELKSALKLLGFDSEKEFRLNILILFLCGMSLLSVLFYHFNTIQHIQSILLKSKYSKNKIYKIFILNFVIIAIPSFLLGLLLAYQL